jgi:long-chain acyl-CoA synthetase
MADVLDLTAQLSGRRILLFGGSGFLGKVTLSLLLERFPEIGQVVLATRPTTHGSATERVYADVLPTEPFRPLRERYGDEGSYDYFREKLRVVAGDVAKPGCGVEDPGSLGPIDLVINCAGLVTFNPSLALALEVNAVGARSAAELALSLQAPLLHVSTCFVAGERRGPVFEDEPILGSYPRRADIDGPPLLVDAEIEDLRRLVARAREQSLDLSLTAGFHRDAVARLRADGRHPAGERELRLAIARERKLWLANELVRLGMERARAWGWPNTYTLTKALAEQAVVQAGQRGLRYTLVRPSIVESALRFPFPGWNEGFTTSAPLAFLGLKGHRALPAGERNILDLVPVDLVAAGIIGAAAAAIEGTAAPVYQLASGDLNPFYAARAVELVGLYRRRVYRRRESDGFLEKAKNGVLSRLEMRPTTKTQYDLTSAPLFKRASHEGRAFLKKMRPRWGAPNIQAAVDRLDERLAELERQSESIADLIDLFTPFLWDNAYVFRCDQTRALFDRISEKDRERIPWNPQELDWRAYFLEVHMAGLEQWVFPGLEEERVKRGKRVRAHRDLLELFYASVEAFGPRVAFRRVGEGGEVQETITYARTGKLAERIAAYLQALGLKRGQRVLLCAPNQPEWPIAYFGILLAGGIAVPVDPELSRTEVENLAAASEARVALFSQMTLERMSGLRTDAHVTTLEQALQPSDHALLRELPGSEDPASLIFTSGTTGKPKGVLLSHRNFAQLCQKLSATFELGVGDGVLSVLPLHHTFEFSCGLLTPFAVGAEVTYLDEITSDRLSDALATGRIHAMVGVPALFQLLHRKLTQELAGRPAWVEQLFGALIAGNRELRNRLGLNLGKLLFWPVHNRLGGRLRVLVSGGSALSEEVHDAFRGLGFDLTEGYGLTEAAPVLTVTPPGDTRLKGSVGRPLPGVELKIDSPDHNGVGEVLAKGPNVMLGYFGDAAATAEVLQDGWLRTGDLGRLDPEGNLFLSGRKKDLILDASGRNIYPDEIEELYAADAPAALKELCVVGIPDGTSGESIACLAVINHDADGDRAEKRAAVEAHFRKVSSDLPFARRIKVLHLWEADLPRTATRKVQRNKVAVELMRLESIAQRPVVAVDHREEPHALLIDRVAAVARRNRTEVRLASRLSADLGFDSLLFTELAVALEEAGLDVPDDLAKAETVSDLAKLLERSPRVDTGTPHRRTGDDSEIYVPGPVAAAGRALLGEGQKLLYHRILATEVIGRAHIPRGQPFLVAANHCSHLDMGLIKLAMGEEGQRLCALAARDYFFDTPLKRAYFENFTRLIPMDRQGSLKASLRLAGRALQSGKHLLIFPEGTRSVDGVMAEFKPTLGFLSLTHGVGVLPTALFGTYEALPRGAILPRSRHLGVTFGPFISFEELRAATAGKPKGEAHRMATQIVEASVRSLLQGERPAAVASAKAAGPESSGPSMERSTGGYSDDSAPRVAFGIDPHREG